MKPREVEVGFSLFFVAESTCIACNVRHCDLEIDLTRTNVFIFVCPTLSIDASACHLRRPLSRHQIAPHISRESRLVLVPRLIEWARHHELRI